MVKLYSVGEGGSSCAVKPVVCKNEDEELQTLLERTPDLLPGDQISPDDPRRWIIIQREMGVPDPNSGTDRWSIDFLMADQDAMPTFVEVKRFTDSRSRREVVGQMLDYAANGHYYWEKDQLRDCAEATAVRMNTTLEDCLAALGPTDTDTVDAFFQKLQDNLREGQVRLVFFLEKSPMELRSVVDFLNRQMERSEVLLVEAQIFQNEQGRFVVPVLFGYSEEARRTKRTVTVSSESNRKGKRWDEASFFAKLMENADVQTVAATRRLYEFAKSSHPFEVRWGAGRLTGTMMIDLPAVGSSSVIIATTGGGLAIQFQDDKRGDYLARLHQLLTESVGISLPDGHAKDFGVKPEEWTRKVDAIIEVYKVILAEFA